MIILNSVEIRIENRSVIKEISLSFGTVYFGGYFIYEGKNYNAENVAVILENKDFFLNHLSSLIGEFTFIQTTMDGTIAAVDRKRSIPLFYYEEKGTWIITDKLLGDTNTLNKTAVKEFILTGFTAGKKTLYDDKYQLEAGTYLEFDKNGKPAEHIYFEYYHAPIFRELESLSKELEEIMHQVFRDLSARLAGKRVILPLSGGYDSRIVALLLKKHGVKNISAFTYGKKGNQEALISKEIADKLDIEWQFIEYNKKDWHEWYNSSEWEQYVDFAVNGSSMAHLQDWPAVTQITSKNAEPSVFIPGHSGDFLAGSHLAYEITIPEQQFTANDVIQFILQKHHKLWTIDKGIERLGSDVIAEITQSFAHLPYRTNEEASAAFEYWDWKERQAKFIINSVRVYEFYGQEWEIPLWDDRLMKFFMTVPVEYRFKKYLYDYTLHKMFPEYFPLPAKVDGKNTSLKEKYGVFYKTAKKLYNKKKLLEQYYTEPMEWYGIYNSYPEYLRELSFKWNGIHYRQPYNINSFLVKDYIRNLKGEGK